jgi:hypothetical protein
MALDQRTIDCLALDSQLSPVMRRDGEAVVPEATADSFNDTWQPGLQAFVDEMDRTFPRRERAYELVVLTSYQGRGTGNHSILVCTDGRIVYAETEVGVGLARFHEFQHGKLVIRTRLRTLRPEIQLGQRPALVWPGLAGSEAELQDCLEAVQPETASHLAALMARLDGGDVPRLHLVGTGGTGASGGASTAPATPRPKATPPTGNYLEQALSNAVTSTLRDTSIPEPEPEADRLEDPAAGDLVDLNGSVELEDSVELAGAVATDPDAPPPPGWYPDPTGRQDHRWWDGATWTDHASKSGVALLDPLAR